MQNARRNLMKNKFFASGDNRMTGITATLITGHNIDLFGQNIHHLGFAFLAPLSPNNDHVFLLLFAFNHLFFHFSSQSSLADKKKPRLLAESLINNEDA